MKEEEEVNRRSMKRGMAQLGLPPMLGKKMKNIQQVMGHIAFEDGLVCQKMKNMQQIMIFFYIQTILEERVIEPRTSGT